MHHNWIPSTLGYGGTLCSRCFVTKREAAALGTLGHCDVLVAPPPAEPFHQRKAREMDMTAIDLQNREFEALTDLSKRWQILQRIAVVDGDYPEARCRYEGAMHRFIAAITANGRLPTPQKIDLFAMHEKMTGHLFPAYSNTDERFLALALCGEAGELANYIKKRWRDGADLTGEIRDEIADIRVYLELLAKCFGIEGDKLDAHVEQKLRKVVEKHHARLSA